MSTGTANALSMDSTSLSSETRAGAEPPISFANRASFRRLGLVSRMSRSMSWVVTGAPFSMLAELPMTIASSLAVRSALASATSVRSESSEDVATVLPPPEEHGSARRRQEEAAHDQPEVAGIDLRDLRCQLGTDVADRARQPIHIARPSSALAITARGSPLGDAFAQPASPAHLPRVHTDDRNPSAWVLLVHSASSTPPAPPACARSNP